MDTLKELESIDLMDSEETSSQFYKDVVNGLKAPQKHLSSKYFYNEHGDILFQKIMNCKDYYLTRAEMDIFQNSSAQLADGIRAKESAFDLIELGAGDATKTFHLLKYLTEQNTDFRYLPIDISEHILNVLENNLFASLPNLSVCPIQGDYFEALLKACELSSNRKVILFLGANIGNMSPKESLDFCRKLSQNLTKGDRIIIGFDLKKNPATILKAYNDSEGFTSQFNLNLLVRINQELEGNFDIANFEHYQTYDPETGACKSYLVSLCKQEVTIGSETISFTQNESIFMEVSQKYALTEIEKMAIEGGFKPISNCFDTHNYFVDTIWEVA
jgi:L-histidine N-alpha-methyltransferase